MKYLRLVSIITFPFISLSISILIKSWSLEFIWVNLFYILMIVSPLISILSWHLILKKFELRWRYGLLIIFLLVPNLLYLGFQHATDSLVCSIGEKRNIRNLANISIGKEVEFCGYLNECQWLYEDGQQYPFEVCLIQDTLHKDDFVAFINHQVSFDDPLNAQLAPLSNRLSEGTLYAHRGKINSVNLQVCVQKVFNCEKIELIAEIRR